MTLFYVCGPLPCTLPSATAPTICPWPTACLLLLLRCLRLSADMLTFACICFMLFTSAHGVFVVLSSVVNLLRLFHAVRVRAGFQGLTSAPVHSCLPLNAFRLAR